MVGKLMIMEGDGEDEGDDDDDGNGEGEGEKPMNGMISLDEMDFGGLDEMFIEQEEDQQQYDENQQRGNYQNYQNYQYNQQGSYGGGMMTYPLPPPMTITSWLSTETSTGMASQSIFNPFINPSLCHPSSLPSIRLF